tara:strand:+ start:2549 stop:3877 length:1329 start_codon:yes stop_codon:yes gene_type:complete
MKNALILAYDFPPYNSVGALRPKSWLNHMHEFNIRPIVVTRQWSNSGNITVDYVNYSPKPKQQILNLENGVIIETPYKPNIANRMYIRFGKNKFSFLRKIISFYYEVFQFIFLVGPKKEIYFSARQYLKKNNVDIIIATGEPFVLFHYAKKLSNEFNIPWVADYRDPWFNDSDRGPLIKRVIFDKFMEKKVVKTALFITTVSELFKKYISENIKSKKIFIIENGFDSDAIEEIQNITQNSKVLTVSFVGTIYKWHPINSIFSTLKKIIKSNPEFKIKFNLYGINDAEKLKENISTNYLEIKSFIEFHPKTNNKKLLSNLRSSNILLLFNYYSFMGTKIYDYLGTNRRILFCFKNDSEAIALKDKFYNYKDDENFNVHPQIDLLNKTNSGIIVENKDHLYDTLLELNEIFKKKKLIPVLEHNNSNYSRREQCKLLCENIINYL